MTTKKILLVVGGVVAVLGLVVILIVGGILWVAFTAIGKSEAAQTAKTFLQQNEKLEGDIGEVRDFGFFVTGNINSHNADGEATLKLKTIGERKTVPVSLNLTYRNGRDWIVVAASYKNDAGQTVNLLNPYEAQDEATGGTPPQVEADTAGTGGTGESFDEESFAANVTQAEGTTLVVFLSQYSLDSRALETTLDELAGDYSERVNLVRYSVDEQPALYRRFRVERLPLVLVYRDGTERERRAGALSRTQLAALLDKHLETE